MCTFKKDEEEGEEESRETEKCQRESTETADDPTFVWFALNALAKDVRGE